MFSTRVFTSSRVRGLLCSMRAFNFCLDVCRFVPNIHNFFSLESFCIDSKNRVQAFCKALCISCPSWTSLEVSQYHHFSNQFYGGDYALLGARQLSIDRLSLSFGDFIFSYVNPMLCLSGSRLECRGAFKLVGEPSNDHSCVIYRKRRTIQLSAMVPCREKRLGSQRN